MEQHDDRPAARRKHLLTDAQLASHAGADAETLSHSHRQSNGLRVHRTYILIVSLVALVLIVGAIAVASTTM